MNPFSYSDYFSYLQNVLETEGTDRGYKTKLARALGVHPSYITRILERKTQLTPDQAATLADFWGLSEEEREYFLWLVMAERAGSSALKSVAKLRLQALKEAQQELEHSLPAEKMSSTSENEYYFNWTYAAVHMLATIAGLGHVKKIAERLALPATNVQAIAQRLVAMGLIKVSASGVISILQKNIHLSNHSWMAALQHRNWRIAAAERIGRPGLEDYHYSGVHTLSKQDLKRLQALVRDFLVATDKLVRPSAEETLAVLCLDLFEL